MNTNVKSPEATEAVTAESMNADHVLAALAGDGKKIEPPPQAAWQPDQKWVASWRFCPH